VEVASEEQVASEEVLKLNQKKIELMNQINR
jgi:hypothetical protein